MELKKEERDLQFSLWLIASILLHILILLIFLLWYFETSFQRHLNKREPEIKTMPLTPKQLLQQQKEEARKSPVLWKDLKKPEKKEELQYTLVPGRQAVTQADAKDATKPEKKEEKSIAPLTKTPEQPKEQTVRPEQTLPTPKESQKQQEEAQKPQKSNDPIKLSKQKTAWAPIQEKTKAVQQAPPKTTEQRHDDLKEKLFQEAQLRLAPQKTQDQDQLVITPTQASPKTDTTNPTIVKNKVTLKDLQLGFSKFMQEGNNDILLQRGNTTQSPDTQALRLITYQQQFAHTMREAIIVHHQYHLVQHLRGTRPTYSITIDRSGKLLNFTMTISSGNELLDKIMKEALEAVRLYPAMPQHITGDTFSHLWTFVH